MVLLQLCGGNRIGITGEVVEEEGKIKNIKNISSMNIRVAHEVIGCSDSVIDRIYNGGSILNTLIVSPPGFGKTTFLRDVIRNISIRGKNVGVVDERYEIANVFQGIPTLNIGPRTDVISGITKSRGINTLVRSMGLDVIATDEVGSIEDKGALLSAVSSGVKIIATAHGDTKNNLPYSLKSIMTDGVFDIVIYLSGNIGTIEKIVDLRGDKKCLLNVC